MVSGRGLGHTGGTLDKLESIPGFTTQLPPGRMKAQLETLGVVMVGQGPDLAPADGRLYALRDVTATVEFVPFIVSSIVSKKVAEGAQALVYDVKCGCGAFMTSQAQASELARRLVETTQRLGRRATALVTDMSRPLGIQIGNALEVKESIELLRGGGPADTRELALTLASEMLALAGVDGDPASARQRAERALGEGTAWRLFVKLVGAQGGDVAAIEDPSRLPHAPVRRELRAARQGFLGPLDTRGLGELVVAMGGGRRRKEDAVDPRVGVTLLRRVGEAVGAGEPVAVLHLARDDGELVRRGEALFGVSDVPPTPAPLVLERIA
jgi:pyrimidine-nucleoside phosphorylase